MNEFYTYFHTRNDTGAVFYVGKGKGRRAYEKARDNPHWSRTVAKHGHQVHVALSGLSEEDAFSHERFLIQCFKDLGVVLVNVTDGGEGASGLKHREETKNAIALKMAVIKTGVPRPDWIIRKMAEANKTRVRPAGEVEKRRVAMLGNRNGVALKGVPKSEAARANMRAAWVKKKEVCSVEDLSIQAVILNSQRWRCLECGMVSLPGPLGKHLSRSGHSGKERVL